MLNSKNILSLVILISLLSQACSDFKNNEKKHNEVEKPKYLVTRRDDGSLSGICQYDDDNLFHGLSRNYFADGKTLHSTINYKHGKKHGLLTNYYKNGQVSKYVNYVEGKKHGPSRKYYKNGKLMSASEYENGYALPGLKEYKEDGSLVTNYPDFQFREINYLKSKNRIDIEISCSRKSDKVKYFMWDNGFGTRSRVFLLSEKGVLTRNFYISPGKTLDTELEYIVEVPTDYGNTLVKTLNYHLNISN